MKKLVLKALSYAVITYIAFKLTGAALAWLLAGEAGYKRFAAVILFFMMAMTAYEIYRIFVPEEKKKKKETWR